MVIVDKWLVLVLMDRKLEYVRCKIVVGCVCRISEGKRWCAFGEWLDLTEACSHPTTLRAESRTRLGVDPPRRSSNRGPAARAVGVCGRLKRPAHRACRTVGSAEEVVSVANHGVVEDSD